MEAAVTAYATNSKNVIVNAMAGVGKTTTIVRAVKEAQKQQRVKTVVLAFNRSAADDLQEKFRDCTDVTAETFHTFAKEQLQYTNLFRGVDTAKLGFSPKKKEKIVKHYTPFSINANEKDRNKKLARNHRAVELLQYMQRHLVDIDDNCTSRQRKIKACNIIEQFAAFCDKTLLKQDMICEFEDHIIPLWDLNCGNTSELDYDDVIYFMATATGIQDVNKFERVVVDEAQDVNKAQIAMLFKVAAASAHFLVIGDIFQRIYSFQGAVHNFVDHFKASFDDNKVDEPMELDITSTQRKHVFCVLLRLSRGANVETGCAVCIAALANNLVHKIKKGHPAFVCGRSLQHEDAKEVKYILVSAEKNEAFINCLSGVDAPDLNSNDSSVIEWLVLCTTNAHVLKEAVSYFEANKDYCDVIVIGSPSMKTDLKAILTGSMSMGAVTAKIKQMENERSFGETKDAIHRIQTLFSMYTKVLTQLFNCLKSTAAMIAWVNQKIVDIESEESSPSISDVINSESKCPVVYFSTVHKSKGLTANNVWIMVHRNEPTGGDSKHVRYVAVTRAKHTLFIVYTDEKFKKIFCLEDPEDPVDSLHDAPKSKRGRKKK